MIKNKKHHDPKNKFMATIISILAIIGIAVLTFKIIDLTQNKNKEAPKASETTKENDNSQTTAQLNSPQEENTPTPELKTPIQNDPVDTGTAQNSAITGYINRLEKTSSNLMILLTINQLIGSSGTCELSMNNGEKTLLKQAPTIANPSSSSCEGFNIPLTELSTGDWTIDIKITSGENSGHITGKVTI